MNNHFCPSPFIYISNNLEGKLRYCCLVHTGLKDENGKEFHSSTSTLDEVWNSADLNSVRDKMAKRVIVPNKKTRKDKSRTDFVKNGMALPPTVLDNPKSPVRLTDSKFSVGGL